jgi:kinesin family protein 5
MLFDLMEQDDQGIEFTLSLSMLEIYKEELYDLLSENSLPLHIKESRNGGVFVENLSYQYVSDTDQILGLIDLGNKAKAVASTKMNAESSRSHTIVSLDIVMKQQDGSVNKGRLNLVDLAGSEKIKKTGAQGETLEEAKKINLSLTALSHCIYALTKSESHIPYRSSKLTRYLQNSLGGNSKTTLIVACSSDGNSVAETISSLEFATRAKKIKNKIVVNMELSAELLQEKLKQAEYELRALRDYVAELEAFSVSQGLQIPRPGEYKGQMLEGGYNMGMMIQRPRTNTELIQTPVLTIGDDDGFVDGMLMNAVHGKGGFTGNLKQKFSEKVNMLTKRK